MYNNCYLYNDFLAIFKSETLLQGCITADILEEKSDIYQP